PSPKLRETMQIAQAMERAMSVAQSADRGKVVQSFICDPATIELRDVGIVELKLGRFTCELRGHDSTYLFTMLEFEIVSQPSNMFRQFHQVTEESRARAINAVNIEQLLRTKLPAAVAECAREEQRRDNPGAASDFARKWLKDGRVQFRGMISELKLSDADK